MNSCSHCGGSGNLRLGEQSYRTCLECLGQGQVPGSYPAMTTAAVLQGRLPRVNASPSSVAR
ncbi:hypothetical protein [Cyanobium sp. HWJ4-Hawea]|uniref:hypothetical protein n=1 Tax=Cyanobium sp. HWJ4-Hawea TaxID=2823713 RepID=UPI0020CFE6FE|nr:hypothetical protein [Cyanobium sp. HWJ4-Hawea]